MTGVIETDALINRREAIRRVSALLGGVALVGGSNLLTGCMGKDSAPANYAAFTVEDIAFLDEIAETILPATKTPGAKAAKVGAFMTVMVTDSYSPRDQQAFRNGMRALDDASKKANNVGFMAATPAQRLALLNTLDREQKAERDSRDITYRAVRQRLLEIVTGQHTDVPKSDLPPVHYFRMMKELALLGYFTSEIGYTKAQRYTEVPGRYDPCVPYVKGETSWAPHA